MMGRYEHRIHLEFDAREKFKESCLEEGLVVREVRYSFYLLF